MASTPTPTALEIHSGLVLKGQLSSLKDVVLTGRFDGDLQTYGKLTVATGAVIQGTIDASALELEPGNLVEARVQVRKHEMPPMAPVKESKKAPGGGGWMGRFQRLKELALGRK